MSAVNSTKFQPAVFLLSGILEQEDFNVWISIPFSFIYFISILGNSVILFIIKTDATLHEPMYIFLSMLAITDIGLSISTMPTTLGLFWFNSQAISHEACFAQLFFIQSLGLTESSILLFMAFDRLVAICNPLRYASILTPPRIAKMLWVTLLRVVAVILPLPILLTQQHFCQANILSHSFCHHQDVLKLTCSDIRVNVTLGLSGLFFSEGLDFLLIFLSYVIILKTVLRIASHTERLKSLNTCLCHIYVVLLFYIPLMGLSVTHRFMKFSSPMVQIVMGYVCFLLPPLMNPIVYSIKNKHIRSRIFKMFVKQRVSFPPAP